MKSWKLSVISDIISPSVAEEKLTEMLSLTSFELSWINNTCQNFPLVSGSIESIFVVSLL